MYLSSVSRLLTVALMGAILCLPTSSLAQDLFGDLLDDRVVGIDVWVVDKKGNPVSGLSPTDFVLLEDGQQIEISTVQAAGSATGTRTLVVFFDNLHLQTSSRSRAIKSLSKSFEQGLPAEDRVMVATYDDLLTVRLPFSSDTGDIVSTFNEIASEPAGGDEIADQRKTFAEELEKTKSDCTASTGSVRDFAQGEYDRVEKSLSGLETLVRSLATVEGEKAILMISGGLELYGGRDLFELLASNCKGDQDAVRQVSENFSHSDTLIHLSAVANRNGVTLFPLEATGQSKPSPASSKATQRSGGGNKPTGMVVKGADGVPMNPVSGLGDGGNTLPPIEQLRISNLQSSLAYMAAQTGGTAAFNTTNYKAELDQLFSELGTQYSVEFSPDRSPDGRVHVLELQVGRKGTTARYGKSYLDQRPSRDYGDRLLGFLLYQSPEANNFGVEIEPLAAGAASGDTLSVPLQVKVPLGSVVLKPIQGELGGRLQFIAAAQAVNGQTTSLQQETVVIKPGPGAPDHVQTLQVTLLPGRQTLALAVVDDGGDSVSFVKQQLEVGSN